MSESKKTWIEPELIVLVRSKPEEAVLVLCKMDDEHNHTGPDSSNYSCTVLAAAKMIPKRAVVASSSKRHWQSAA